MNSKPNFTQTLWARLYLPLLLLLCVAYAWKPIEGGFDFWAHAAVGKWIWTHQQAPRTGLFLWSEPGTPWVAHSWLSEVLFFGIFSFGGARLVVILTALLAALIFFLLWRVWRQQAPIGFWVPLVFALAIWVSAPRFQPRQEMISALFLVLLLAFLIAWHNGRFDDWLQHKGLVDAAIIGLPIIALFFLWVNLHALVALGLLILGCSVLGSGAQALFGSDRFDSVARHRALSLLAVGVLCALATLLNPYGLAVWNAADQLKPGNMSNAIEEWKPFWAYPQRWEYAAVEAVLCGIALMAIIFNPQRRWTHFLWLGLAAVLTIRSRRMEMLAAIIFLAIMAANARALESPKLWLRWRNITRGDLTAGIPNALRTVAHIGAVVCLLAWVSMAVLRHAPGGEAGPWTLFARNVPEGASRYLSKQPQSLRVFNDYEDSSYFQWRLNGSPEGVIEARGRHPLYIDLLNAYPDSLMFEYLDILSASPGGLQKLRERKISCVVLGDHRWFLPPDKNGKRRLQPLAAHLQKSAEWKLVFEDRQSKIWEKRVVNAR
jgi:hypothetical protein